MKNAALYVRWFWATLISGSKGRRRAPRVGVWCSSSKGYGYSMGKLLMQATEITGVVAGPELELEAKAGVGTAQDGPRVEPAPKVASRSPVRRKRQAAEVSGRILCRTWLALSL